MTGRTLARSVVVTGAGGVGKTTVAAAMGVAAARAGIRTLVVTIDPAKRLGDALGVGPIGNHPTPVVGEQGLWAAMLDVAASWEAIIERHAEPDVARRLQDNRFFRAIADRFPAAQAYAAGEQLADYLEAGAWEAVIVDTPPAAGGIEFFTAPSEMSTLIGGRVLRFLTGAGLPGRRTLYRLTARPVFRLVDSVVGGPLLQDIAEFLLDLRSLYDGLARRATVIESYLARSDTLVVTTSAPTPLTEAERFFDTLRATPKLPSLVVFNKVLPEDWSQPDFATHEASGSPTLDELQANLARWGAEASRQARSRRLFTTRHSVSVATLPWLETSPTDLEALASLTSETGAEAIVDLLQ